MSLCSICLRPERDFGKFTVVFCGNAFCKIPFGFWWVVAFLGFNLVISQMIYLILEPDWNSRVIFTLIFCVHNFWKFIDSHFSWVPTCWVAGSATFEQTVQVSGQPFPLFGGSFELFDVGFWSSVHFDFRVLCLCNSKLGVIHTRYAGASIGFFLIRLDFNATFRPFLRIKLFSQFVVDNSYTRLNWQVIREWGVWPETIRTNCFGECLWGLGSVADFFFLGAKQRRANFSASLSRFWTARKFETYG